MHRKKGYIRGPPEKADHMKARDLLRNKSFGDVTYIQYGLWFPIGPLLILWGLVGDIQANNTALSIFLLSVGGLISLWVMVGYSANAVVIFRNLDIDDGGIFVFSQVMMIILLIINGLVIVGAVWTIVHVARS